MYKDKTKKRRLYYDEAIRLHYEKGYGEFRIAKILPVGHTTIGRWIANFASENNDDNVVSHCKTKEMKSKTDKSENASQEEVESLKAEISRLQKALDYEKLRSQAYNKMIDIAEQRYKIPIRKKRGAKQS